LMNPAKELDRSVALLAQPLAKLGQTLEVKIKQVDRH